jgi:hypothetical protein
MVIMWPTKTTALSKETLLCINILVHFEMKLASLHVCSRIRCRWFPLFLCTIFFRRYEQSASLANESVDLYSFTGKICLAHTQLEILAWTIRLVQALNHFWSTAFRPNWNEYSIRTNLVALFEKIDWSIIKSYNWNDVMIVMQCASSSWFVSKTSK